MTILHNLTFEDNVLWQRRCKTAFEYVLSLGGTLEVATAAAHSGTYGLKATPRSNSTACALGSVFLESPTVQRAFRQRFYLHPNGIAIPSGYELRIARNNFPAYNFACYNIRLGYLGTSYYINFSAYNGVYDDASMGTSGNQNITNAWHYIEMKYVAAVSGSVQVWVDGTSIGTVSGDNHDASVPAPGIGYGYPATSGYSCSGSMYFDDLIITDDPDTAIGA